MPLPSPFPMEQQRWIIFRYGACPSVKTIRREFRQKFDVPPFDVPRELAFYRIIKKFNTTNSTVPKSKKEDGGGRPMTGRSPENIDTIRQSITQAGDQSIRVLSLQNDIPQTTVQRILRKDLRWFPYKPNLVQPLSDRHIQERNRFCHWLLSKGADFPQQVIWSDEKMWMDKRIPNKQNERYWAAENPYIDIDCSTQTVHKRMSWAGIVDGKVILYWFDEGVRLNHESYLDILRTFVWPRVRRKVADQDLWWQQDGATSHTVEIVRNWLDTKFDGRVISNKMTHVWPPCSPDLSPLDFWFWGHAMHHLKTTKPLTIEQLMVDVNNFASHLDQETVKKAVKDIISRAGCCLDNGGSAFESKLKAYKRIH